MKKFTKILSVIMAMVLCVVIGVGATLAWLTDTTEEVVNTFSAAKLINPTPDPEGKGGFDIWEHESQTNEDGSNELLTKKPLVQKNTYPRVLPDVDLNKDPFVRIRASEDAYVYVEVCGTLPAGMTWKEDSTNWTTLETDKIGPNGGKLFVYCGTQHDAVTNKDVTGYITPGMDGVDINILDGKIVDVAPTFEPSSLTAENNTLTFYGYAAQHNHQETAQIAWTNAGFPAAPAK